MEEDQIKKILKGDKAELRKFYFNYKQRLFNFIKRKINTSEDVEEIMQDVFIEALDALRDFSGRSSIYTFLCAIASHKVIDFYRKKKVKNIFFSQMPEDIKPLISQALGPEEEYGLSEIRDQIDSVLGKMRPSYSRLLKLKYIDGFSVIEIAKKLLVSSKSVESNLFRARLAFVKQYRLLYIKD